MGEQAGALEIRRAVDADLPAVLELLRASMGRADDDRFTELFRWKHLDNAFGASPAWVAVDGDRLAAVRYLMRWQFVRPDGSPARAVRAVDTATHPDYQGRGLFRTLTMGALDALAAEGVDFVFNTPNDQSRPGYLKMGWKEVGTLPIHVRPLGIASLVRLARARVPAGHFSLPTSVAEAAGDVLADDAAIVALLGAGAQDGRLRTAWTPDTLRWRFASDLLPYRAVVAPGGVAEGIALFRLRARGPATEAALALVLAASADSGRALVRAVERAVRRRADYVVALGARPRRGYLPLSSQGPLMTWRSVTDTVMPPLDSWALSLGDIELF